MKKKITFLAMLVVMLAFGFVSCDDGTTTTAGEGNNVNVVGRWDTGEYILAGYGTVRTILEFRADGTFVETSTGALNLVESGTYSVSGNRVTLNYIVAEWPGSWTATVTGNQLRTEGNQVYTRISS